MNTVFVITRYIDGEMVLISIWSSKELAEQAINEYQISNSSSHYCLEAVNVDEP